MDGRSLVLVLIEAGAKQIANKRSAARHIYHAKKRLPSGARRRIIMLGHR